MLRSPDGHREWFFRSAEELTSFAQGGSNLKGRGVYRRIKKDPPRKMFCFTQNILSPFGEGCQTGLPGADGASACD